MREYIRVMKALSDPNRVKIIKLLEQKELCVCEIHELVGLAQSTVSKHLKILEEADLVAFRKKGPWIHYSLRTEGGNPYAAAQLRLVRTWLNDEPHIREALAGLGQVDTLRTQVA